MRPADQNPRPERRATALLLGGGVIAAVVLLLGVNGTLSSWTTAVIDNTNNNVASAASVSLLETGPGSVTCDTAASTTNSATCSTINKYGGTAVPLSPSGSQSVSVNLKNTGTASGDLVLTADACTHSANLSNANLTQDLCTQMHVQVTCASPGTLTTATTTLAAFTGGSVGTLAANSSTDCTFTLTLPAGTPAEFSGQVASQGLHWTLTAA
jgi:hypothetical protein